MSYFECRLRIGYKAKDNKTPILNDASDEVNWIDLTATQRTNLLDALQTKVKDAFPMLDPNNDNAPFFDLWQNRMISIGGNLSNQEVEGVLSSYLNKRLDEAAGNDVYKVGPNASHVEYTHYDNKVICEHYFKVLNEADASDWKIENVPFDSDGGGTMWSVSANLLELAIRYNPV
ncbi:MAG: hypothetical protein V3T86_01940 [Planctomycetota bacterium]